MIPCVPVQPFELERRQGGSGGLPPVDTKACFSHYGATGASSRSFRRNLCIWSGRQPASPCIAPPCWHHVAASKAMQGEARQHDANIASHFILSACFSCCHALIPDPRQLLAVQPLSSPAQLAAASRWGQSVGKLCQQLASPALCSRYHKDEFLEARSCRAFNS